MAIKENPRCYPWSFRSHTFDTVGDAAAWITDALIADSGTGKCDVTFIDDCNDHIVAFLGSGPNRHRNLVDLRVALRDRFGDVVLAAPQPDADTNQEV